MGRAGGLRAAGEPDEPRRYIVKFMPMEQGNDLQRLLVSSGSIKIKYSDYDWTFRGWFFAGENHMDTCVLTSLAAR